MDEIRRDVHRTPAHGAHRETSNEESPLMHERDLWSFANALYEQNGVAEICLDWQNHRGVDVTVLLFAAWAASNGQTLSVEDVSTASDLIASWRDDVVQPLRTIRRRLKQHPISANPATNVRRVRDIVMKAELESERVALAVLGGQRMKKVAPAPEIDQIAATNITNVDKHFAALHASDSDSIKKIISAIISLQGPAS